MLASHSDAAYVPCGLTLSSLAYGNRALERRAQVEREIDERVKGCWARRRLSR